MDNTIPQSRQLMDEMGHLKMHLIKSGPGAGMFLETLKELTEKTRKLNDEFREALKKDMIRDLSIPGQVTINPLDTRNSLCGFSLDLDSKMIHGENFHPDHIDERCISVTKRSLGKAWGALQEKMTPGMLMHDAITILEDNGITMKCYFNER